jgi:hypothetical protein
VFAKCTRDRCHVFAIEVSCVYKVYMTPLPRVTNRSVMCPQSVHGSFATCFQKTAHVSTKCTWDRCRHMTLLLQTRGNGLEYTLRTHNTVMGNTWQRSHKVSCVHKVYMGPLPRVSNRSVMCLQSVHETVATCFQ